MPTSSVDLSGIWKTQQPTSEPATPASPASSDTDLSRIWGTKQPAPEQTTPATPPSQLASIWGHTEQPAASPENGQGVRFFMPQDENPDYDRSHLLDPKTWWKGLNAPIFDFTALGTRQGAGKIESGVEKGVENILSGFTSPVSLALTLGTFGTGGAIESAGANLLSKAGLSAEEIANASKAAEIATKAAKDLRPIEPEITSALEAGGHDLDLFNRAKQALGPTDLSTSFGEDAVQKALSAKGFSPEEIEQLGAASKTAKQAIENFTPVEDAVKGAGLDFDKFKQAQDILYNNGLTEHDLIGGNLVERGAFHIIKNTVPGISIPTAVRAAKTANTLMSAGFTYQQLETAAALSPKFLDALSSGDYEKAAEYGTEAATAGGLGILGTPHALHAAGELFKPVLETNKFRPNDEWLALDRANKERDAQHAVAEQQATDLDKRVRGLLGHKSAGPLGLSAETKGKQDLELASIFHQVVTGGDADKAAAWYNALAEASGKSDRLPVSGGLVGYHGTPFAYEGNPRTDGLGAHFTLDKKTASAIAGDSGRVIESRLGIKNPLRVDDLGGSHSNAENVVEDFVKQGVIPKSFLKDVSDGQLYLRSKEIVGDIGDLQGPELAKKRNDAFDQANQEVLGKVKGYLKSKGYDGLVYKNKVEGGGDSFVAFDPEQIRPNNGQLPEGVADQIKNSAFPKTAKAYQDLVLNSLKRVANGELSDKEIEAAKQLREEDANNYQMGSANDILHGWIADHMTRLYKDDPGPDGRIALSNAKMGKFATNVTQARHQVYDSHLTALLKSPREIVLDPVFSVAQGRSALLKAAANRQLIDTLRDNFTRGSDGRPAVVMNGAGKVLQGPDGQDPKTFISPNRVRKINIADDVVAHLQQTGDLQRFLDDGTIKDITPYVHKDNLAQAIDRLEQKAMSQEAQYDPEGNNILRKEIQGLKDIQTGVRPESDLKGYNDMMGKRYVWDPEGFVSFGHPAFKGWKFIMNDSGENPIFVNSDVMVHPEFAQYLKDRLGLEPSAIQKNPIGKALLGTGTKLKETLLSLSPFHMVQLGLRGILAGVNPFTLEAPDILNGRRIDPSDPYSPTIGRKLVEQGMTVGTDYRALQQHSEGVSSGGGVLKAIPGIGKPLSQAMNWYQDWLFKRYLPAVKYSAAEHLFDLYREQHPDWSVDKAAKAAAIHSNNSFGGINWKAMGRSATTQDWGRLMLLAPDWLESELRSGAQLFGNEGQVPRKQIAIMAMSLWGAARVMNFLTTGKFHNEAPFGLAVKNKDGKETVFSIRTLPTDLLHAASDPVGFLKGRLSPTIRAGQELLTQRDQFGRKLNPEDLWVDVTRQMAPIPIQSLGQAVTGTGPEVGNVGQLVKAVGGTATTYRTPAEKLAADLASNHNEDGPVSTEMMARHRTIQRIEDSVRRGDVTLPELYKMTYQDSELKEAELKRIVNNYKATKGLDAATASLYSRASRLPATEFLQVWDEANPSQRVALLPLMKQTMSRYLKKAAKDMTARDRQNDPTFQRIIRLLPQMETQTQTQQ